MRKFRFPLEAALRLRERNAEDELCKLRNIAAELTAHTALEQALCEDLRVAEEAAAGAAVDPGTLVAMDRFRGAAQRRRRALETGRVEITNRLEAQRAAAGAARRDAELLVRLREKAHADWVKAVEREIEAVAEESYLSRWQAR